MCLQEQLQAGWHHLSVHPLTAKALRTTVAAMNRIFGAKNTAPKPTLQGAIGNVSPPHPQEGHEM